jgi:hypothetical protein
MMPDKEEPPPFLTFARFRLYLRVQTLMVLPPYKGAVFRGAFGSSLRRLVCVAQQPDCRPCLLHERCLYVALFEPPPPPGFAEAGKFQQAPRPYVLNPPLTNRQAFHPGDTLSFDFTLIGPAIEALPYFVYIFDKIGCRGLGPERGKFEIIKVDILKNAQSRTIFDGLSRSFNVFTPEAGPASEASDMQVESITLNFVTPLRLKEKGRLVTWLTFPFFMKRLMERLHLLASFYGKQRGNSPANLSPPPMNSLELLPLAKNVTFRDQGLHWYDWGRKSQRQQTTISLGGIKGICTLRGPITPFLPYLRLAEHVNVGQGTSFGLGKITLAYPGLPGLAEDNLNYDVEAQDE